MKPIKRTAAIAVLTACLCITPVQADAADVEGSDVIQVMLVVLVAKWLWDQIRP